MCSVPEELLKQADIALYRAKWAGRGIYREYEEGMHEEVAARQNMKHDLSLSLQRQELEVYYQPLLELRSGLIIGFEALLRWNHPKKGLISPADFIPLAEEMGLIVPIGEWVLREACCEAAKWPGQTFLAVNLSPVQFRNPALPLNVASALHTAGLPASRLQLEITESVLLHNSDENLQLLNAIRTLGVNIALDDFGTGFSSLSYLRTFVFDKIKIDRSFIEDIGISRHSEAIIQAIIQLAKSMNMSVTAEGVETDAQFNWLKEQGCHEVQGYLIGRPSPPVRALDRLGLRHLRGYD
jgi:EAL domain-containing protein (putative c-di-GMP-specific phosphodiesterase class I)